MDIDELKAENQRLLFRVRDLNRELKSERWETTRLQNQVSELRRLLDIALSDLHG